MDGSFTVCGPTLIVDGSVAATGGPGAPVEIDDHVRINENVAMEIYRNAAEVPPEFRQSHHTCGAIVTWTY